MIDEDVVDFAKKFVGSRANKRLFKTNINFDFGDNFRIGRGRLSHANKRCLINYLCNYRSTHKQSAIALCECQLIVKKLIVSQNAGNFISVKISFLEKRITIR